MLHPSFCDDPDNSSAQIILKRHCRLAGNTAHPTILGCPARPETNRADGEPSSGRRRASRKSSQNATRRPPLAVPVRLWSDIAMPSTAPNSATFLAV